MDDVLTLVLIEKKRNTVGDFVGIAEYKRDVYGSIQSVSRAEWYNAGRAGYNPEIVFVTPIVNYCGEGEAELHGVRYAVYRTYLQRDTDEIELYLERKAGVQREAVP